MNPSRLPHQARVVTERDKFVEKVKKLRAFIATPTFAQLIHPEQVLLRAQLAAMSTYRDVLNSRIALWT